jgi:hypothetical protein
MSSHGVEHTVLIMLGAALVLYLAWVLWDREHDGYL